MSAKQEIQKQKLERLKYLAAAIRPSLTSTLQRPMDLAQEKGASSWLSSVPLEEFGFTLHKGAFRDALTLRYGWLPSNGPLILYC